MIPNANIRTSLDFHENSGRSIDSAADRSHCHPLSLVGVVLRMALSRSHTLDLLLERRA
jgi:hypothetical protein